MGRSARVGWGRLLHRWGQHISLAWTDESISEFYVGVDKSVVDIEICFVLARKRKAHISCRYVEAIA